MGIAKSRAGSRPVRCSRLTTTSLIIELLPRRQTSHRGIVAIRPGAGLDTDQSTGSLIDRWGAAIRRVHALLRNKIGPAGLSQYSFVSTHASPFPGASIPFNPRYLR